MRAIAALMLACATWAADAAPSAAQEQTPAVSAEQLALARRYVNIGGSKAIFVRGAMLGFRAGLTREGMTLTDAQWMELQPLLETSFARPAQIFADELSAYYATNADSADLSAALAYYESGPGQRYAEAAIELVLAMSLYAASGGASTLPGLPEEASLSESDLALAQRMATAFGARLGELERARLTAAGLDPNEFTNLIARFFIGRLSTDDLSTAIQWAETPESRRLETVSPARSAAEEIAVLHAIEAFDPAPVAAALLRILQQAPT